MAGAKKWDVFVSYSHADSNWVTPLVAAFRAAGLRVFFDQDSIPPGAIWRTVIAQSLKEARRVFVFWSHNASDSRAVRREYRAAFTLNTPVVPMLLDKTRMPPSLRSLQ